jgi:hypothetical protein
MCRDQIIRLPIIIITIRRIVISVQYLVDLVMEASYDLLYLA